MTGYGAASISTKSYKISVELRSLNSKFLEVNMKLPRSYMQEELLIRNMMAAAFERGKVNVNLSVEILNPDKHKLRINHPLIKAYARDLEKLREELGLSTGVSLEYILSLPDSMTPETSEGDPEEWNMIESCLREAIQLLNESRLSEGEALEEDLRLRNGNIGRLLIEIGKLLPSRYEAMRGRIEAVLADIKDKVGNQAERFEQELIFYLERLDINEEMVRLEQHVNYFNKTLNEPVSNGKKLGFISQEMGREINTIGSKANDATIQQLVVQMKEDLERIKEQIQNIV
ncbi:MAG: hypothetical protein RLZZ165_976 [Bacteroidota bacterium]